MPSNVRIWDNWLDGINDMYGATDEQKALFLMKCVRYALRGEEPAIEPVEKAMWNVLKPLIDDDAKSRGGRGKTSPKTGSKTGSKTSSKTSLETPAAKAKTSLETSLETSLGTSKKLVSAKKKTSLETPLSETESETESESESEAETEGEGDRPREGFIAEVIRIWNEETGQSIGANLSSEAMMRMSALERSGASLEDVRTVVRSKAAEWGRGRMKHNLRPEVVLGDRFESYLNATKEVPGAHGDIDAIYS